MKFDANKINLADLTEIMSSGKDFWIFQIETRGNQRKLLTYKNEFERVFENAYQIMPKENFELFVIEQFCSLLPMFGDPDCVINLDAKTFESDILKAILEKRKIQYYALSSPITKKNLENFIREEHRKCFFCKTPVSGSSFPVCPDCNNNWIYNEPVKECSSPPVECPYAGPVCHPSCIYLDSVAKKEK